MREFAAFRSRGQTAVLVALMAVGVVALVALGVDASNAYSLRRQAQNAADGGAIAGTWEMVDYTGGSPGADILQTINRFAQANGVPDTNGDPADMVNDNILAYYVYFDGTCVPLGEECWELHVEPNILPGGARGVEVVATISSTTFFARIVGWDEVQATARATARYQPDGGLLPVAVNEYWLGTGGNPNKCPYTNCGYPYSFVRNPEDLPPFSEVPEGSDLWVRNTSGDPYNGYTSQGPYGGMGENFGRAFAALGQDAVPNMQPSDPRSAVVLDVRYDALIEGGNWFELIADGQFIANGPIPDGTGKELMRQVIEAGGYERTPLPATLNEPPPVHVDEWGYCWGEPSEENCFNYPETDREEPYDALQFLSGAAARFLAQEMHNGGDFHDGRYAPGERIVIMVYDSHFGASWGSVNVAPVVGYFGAYIVGYGSGYDYPCDGTPGQWDTYTHCVTGNPDNPNTMYAIAVPGGELRRRPEPLLEDFLPKMITLIR